MAVLGVKLTEEAAAFDAEALIWPHQPGVDFEPEAQELLVRLWSKLGQIPIETFATPAQLGRWLGFRVMLAPRKFPGAGWIWFESKLIEVANWLPKGLCQLIAAHEDCHAVLGPISKRYHLPTERVCNWGAGEILRRLGIEIDETMSDDAQKFRLAEELFDYYNTHH